MNPPPSFQPLGFPMACLYALGAVVCFNLAYAFDGCAFLMVGFLACLFPLARLRTARRAYYVGLVIGLAVYTPHLLFFYGIFGYAAVALWYILPFWLGLFLVLGRACLFRFGPVAWACLAPFLWTGFEFTRGELGYLRFSWLSPGLAFSHSGALHYLSSYGVYGIGFLFLAASGVANLRGRPRGIGIALLAAAALWPALDPTPRAAPGRVLRVAGVQLECPVYQDIRSALDKTLEKLPDTDVFVLSEYTIMGPIPDMVKNWCRARRKYLVIGGEDPVPPKDYYNTAFVVDTNGEIVFRQAKCVPVQFMKDGLSARQQQLWDSPWGKIGLMTCYDASYTRVADELVRQGAQALINPTMDSEEWGAAQHQMHSRIPPMRAAEYGIPVFRVASSGISEFVDGRGRVASSAPFPGQGAMVAASFELPDRGRIPPDRWPARFSAAMVFGLGGWLALEAALQKIKSRRDRIKSSAP
jgi:apolipoprotein N-acyltransferase